MCKFKCNKRHRENFFFFLENEAVSLISDVIMNLFSSSGFSILNVYDNRGGLQYYTEHSKVFLCIYKNEKIDKATLKFN